MALLLFILAILGLAWLGKQGKEYRAEKKHKKKNQWSPRDVDEKLITTILPTINNDEIKKG